MKTSKALAAGIATLSIVMLTMSNTFAMQYGNGGGMGGNMRGNMGYSMGQGMGGSYGYSTSNVLSNIEKGEVNETEIDLLKKQYEEEMMANELYNYFYETYNLTTFKNIAASEATHMAAVKSLLDRYEIGVPTEYDQLKSLYDDLKAKGELSLKDALEVGINIEIVDINDIVTAIKSTDNDDIKIVLTNIGGASYNHLRGFVNALEINGLTTDIDYSNYLTEDDMNTRGSLSYKLVDDLEEQGVELPDFQGSNMMQRGNMNYSMGRNIGNSYNQYANNSVLRARYKNSYQTKYGDLISRMDDEKINNFIEKIDALIEKITDGNYATFVKEKYISMLIALKEIALDNLDEIDLFEGLFN